MANEDEIARLTQAMDRVFAVLGNETPEIAAQVGFELLRTTIWCAVEGEIAEADAHIDKMANMMKQSIRRKPFTDAVH